MDRHAPDLASLVAGVIFAVLGVAFLAGGLATLDVQLRWVWPVVLVVLGVALLVGNRPARGRSAAEQRAEGGLDLDDDLYL